MKKIIFSKKEFSKALFSTININKLRKLIKKYKLSSEYIPIIVMKNILIDLLEDNSSGEGGAATFTIIGQTGYKEMKKQNKGNRSKGMGKKTSSKVNSLNTKSKPIEIKLSNKPVSISVSQQKNLFSKTIVITPNISPKKKVIINSSIKKEEKKQQKPLNKKENITIKTSVKNVSPTIEKKVNVNKNNNKKTQNHFTEQNINQKHVTKIGNGPKAKTNQIKSKTPKYSLQKKSPVNLVAIFSAVSVSFLLGIGLAGMVGHKKSFPSMLVASSLAIVGFEIFAKNNVKIKNKQFVKTIKRT